MRGPIVTRCSGYGLLLMWCFLALSCCTRSRDANVLPKNARARLGQGVHYAIALSRDGKALAVCTSLGLGLYDAETFEQMWFRFSENPITSVTFAPDGSVLASTMSDQIILWDTERGKQIRVLETSGYPIDLVFGQGGKKVAILADDFTVNILDVSTGKILRSMDIPLLMPGFRSGPMPSIELDWSLNGRLIAAGSPDGEAIIWNAKTGKLLHRLSGSNSPKFSPDGTMLASGAGTEVFLWDTETGDQLDALQGLWGIENISWSRDGTTLAVKSTNDTVSLWKAKGKKLEPGVNIGNTTQKLDIRVKGMDFSPDGQRLFSGSSTEIIAWDVMTGKPLRILEGIGNVTEIAFSPDGTRLVSGSREGVVTLWSLETNKPLRRLNGHTDVVWCLAFSPDGTMLATGGGDGRLILWDTRTWEIVHIEVYTDPNSLAFSPDGTIIALGINDDIWKKFKLILWDVRTKSPLRTIEDTGWRVAWSPDRKILASGLEDGTIVLLDAETGQLLHTWQHTDYLWGLTWSPDGTMLSAEGYGTMTVWNVATGEQLRTPQGIAGRMVWSPDWTDIASEAV